MVGAAVVTVVCGKAILTAGVVRFFRSSAGHAVATGVCLAQVGEFSFILAEVARRGRVIDGDLYELIVATTIGTLLLTPYLVAMAPQLARIVARRVAASSPALRSLNQPSRAAEPELSGHVLIVGFGPAGQRVAETLMRRHKSQLVVLELNARSADIARTYGLITHVGDATRADVLECLRVEEARAVVVTIPDPAAARHVIEQARALAPDTPVIARARYHVYRWELLLAGAETVVDEEDQVGFRIAAAVRRRLRALSGGSGSAEDGRP
jgi:CPA2 family monovalent cation:H+ antiporter-2